MSNEFDKISNAHIFSHLIALEKDGLEIFVDTRHFKIRHT